MEKYIKLLELPEEFDLSDLKIAYRQKVLKYHPDKASNEAERIGYEALMRKLNEANKYLKEYLEAHEGKYTKQNDNSNYTEDTYTEENYTEESTQEEYEEEIQDSSSEYNETEEPPKPNELNESIAKVKDWIKKNPKKFALLVIIYMIFLSFVIWLCNLDSGYTPPENTLASQQTDSVQNNQTEQINKPKVPTIEYTKDKELMNEYMGKVHKRIKRNWVLPSGITDEHIRVKVSFKLDKYGQLIGIPEIKQSSGNKRIDKSCIEAVRLTAPFGEFPIDIDKDNVDMEMSFEADKR